MDFDIFLEILIFDPLQGYCMAYSLCIMAYFQNGLISSIFNIFLKRFFAQTNSK